MIGVVNVVTFYMDIRFTNRTDDSFMSFLNFFQAYPAYWWWDREGALAHTVRPGETLEQKGNESV